MVFLKTEKWNTTSYPRFHIAARNIHPTSQPGTLPSRNLSTCTGITQPCDLARCRNRPAVVQRQLSLRLLICFRRNSFRFPGCPGLLLLRETAGLRAKVDTHPASQQQPCPASNILRSYLVSASPKIARHKYQYLCLLQYYSSV